MAKKEGILFRKGRIQGLNRIAIPKELLENLNLKEGDEIAIYFDPEKESIIMKKEGDRDEL